MSEKLKLKIMICVPMRDRTDEEIKASIDEIRHFLIGDVMNDIADAPIGIEIEIIYTDNMVKYHCPVVAEDGDAYGMFCLGNGFANVMSMCDYVAFAPGFLNSRGCLSEVITAMLYNKPVIPFQYNYHTGDLELMSNEDLRMNLPSIINEKLNLK